MPFKGQTFFIKNQISVVKNGLVLWWDVGDLNSYPGTGTTIFDLSGNSNNGTLNNSVAYSTNNGGIFVFNGTNRVTASGHNLSSSDYTVMGAARYNDASNRERMISSDVAEANNNWLLGHWGLGAENYYVNITVRLNNTPSDTNWRIYAGNGNSTGSNRNFRLYVNNVLSVSLLGQLTGTGPKSLSIGAANSTGEFSKGEFSFLLMYNRILSLDEMTQNYSVYRNRFNL